MRSARTILGLVATVACLAACGSAETETATMTSPTTDAEDPVLGTEEPVLETDDCFYSEDVEIHYDETTGEVDPETALEVFLETGEGPRGEWRLAPEKSSDIRTVWLRVNDDGTEIGTIRATLIDEDSWVVDYATFCYGEFEFDG